MSNANWVCFDCRHGIRRGTYAVKTVLCPLCGRECFCLGHKIPVPPKAKVADWEKLKDVQSIAIALDYRRTKAQVARRHEVERRIRELEALPENPSRRYHLRQLREELKSSG
jgi:hypothetical protein